MRVFIAVDPSPEIMAGLDDLLRKLKRVAPPAIAWARNEGLHLTLKFLGGTDEETAGRVAERLRSIAKTTMRFRIAVRGTGRFPDPPRMPRVLWAGIEAGPGLLAMQGRIESAAGELGFPPESRPFHPHLTLGRVRSPGGLGAVLDELAKNEAAVFGDMTVRDIVLRESILKPTGAEYRVLNRAELA